MPFTLPTQEEKAEYVQRQFDRIAQKYDLTNDVISMGMHHSWKRQAIDLLSVQPQGSYLDVCCGTGDLTLKLADRLTDHGAVTGLDFSANMLRVAEQRLTGNSTKPAVSFVQADALALPFANDTFDGAIISFGLRNLTSYQKGIEEMRRVVKPGGVVINLDLGRSTVPIFSQVFAFYFRQIVPIIGQVLQSDQQAYTYLPVSMTAYPAPDGITQIFAAAGLIDVRYHPLALGTVALHKGTVAQKKIC